MKLAPAEATEVLMRQDPEFRRRVLELRAEKQALEATKRAKQRADRDWLRRRNARRAMVQARERYAATDKGKAARARASARYMAKLRYRAALGELF